ncbi:MAG: AraC family transcriptional regulator [Verrucomicrobiota bacterium]
MKSLNHFCRSLSKITAAFDAPEDLFQGLRRSEEKLPDNIIIFSRRFPGELQQTSGEPYFHQRWVMLVPLDGEAVALIERRPHRLGPGQVLVVPPFHLHTYVDIPDRIHWLVITFDWPGHTFLAQEWIGVRDLPEPARPFLSAMVDAWRAPQPNGLRAAAELLSFLREISPSKTKMQDTIPNEELVTRVREVVQKKSIGVSVSEVAKTLGTSESHLRAQFRKAAGIGLGRYLREARLRQAAVWLRDEGMLVKDAAEKAGYADIFTFSRAFSRTVGRPPSAVRKN